MTIEDEDIVNLYFSRNEEALTHTRQKYNSYLKKIISNILDCEEDVEEQLESVYLEIWNVIPPYRPHNLGGFIAQIARRRAIDAFRSLHSKSHYAGNYDVCIDELAEVLPGNDSPFEQFEAKRLGECINAFLKQQKPEKRMVFMGRYFYGESLETIAQKCDGTEAKVKMILFRMRKELKEYLEKEGFNV